MKLSPTKLRFLKAALQKWGLAEKNVEVIAQAKQIKPALLFMGVPARKVRRAFKLAHNLPATNKWDSETIRLLTPYGPHPAPHPVTPSNRGIDYASGYSAGLIPALVKAKVLTCFRYFAASAWKSISHAEFDDYMRSDVALSLVYETGASSILAGASFGTRGATAFRDEMDAWLGKGKWTGVLRLACDFEVRAWHLPAILRALNAAAKVLGSKKRVSVYGNAFVCAWAVLMGFAAPWQCIAWSYGRRASGICAYQYVGKPYRIPLSGYDPDVILGDVGAVRKTA